MCDKDTASEQMDTGDSILGITAVYGTQIVSIKTEEETEIVIKEEEPTIDTEYEELCSDKNYMQIHNLTEVALVYTTRLEDMDTFNNIERYTSEEASKMIVEESKPHYEGLKFPEQQPGLSSDPCINSYLKLCSQIQQLNTKVKNETQLRNQKLLDKCKPLQIVLEDLKTSKRNSRSKTILEYSSDKYVPSIFYSSDDDDEPISKLVPVINRKQAAAPIELITVAVKDKRSQEADIYILDVKKGVKSYYWTSIKECDTIEKLHNSTKTVLLEYCCWVNREKRISRLIQLGFTRSSLFYLRKPHNCLPRPCSCCCGLGTTTLCKSYLISQNTESLVTEVSVPVKSNSVIDKAKNYKTNVPDLPRKKNEPVDYLEWAVIIIKYHGVIFAQTNILGDNYEVGKNGELLNFVRPTVNRSIPEEKQLYEISDQHFEYSRLYFSYLICCWHNREVVIQRLVDASKFNPNILKFIRTSHPCRSDKCICCCKPRPCMNINLNVNVSTFLKNTKKQRNVVTKEKEKRNTSSESKRLIPNTLNKNVGIEIQSKITSSRHKSAPTINKNESPVIRNKQSAALSSVNMGFNSRRGHYSSASNSQTAAKTKQNEPTVNQVIDLTSADTANICSSPSMLINSIFDKFKGLKLDVNENGKLTAVINTAPGTLAREDIKIISDILLIASSQIEKLGITPQEFCSRVNLSRTINGVMPQLVPITIKGSNAPTPDTKVHNTLATPLEHDTQKDPNCCKVQPLSSSSCIPTTSNTSNVCIIYQVMSSLGGQKNQHLVRAYKLHFRNLYTMVEHNIKQPKSQQKPRNAEKRKRPRITTSKPSAVAKRKATQKLDQGVKKLRVRTPQQLEVENSLHSFGNSLTDQTDLENTRKSSLENIVVSHNPTPLIVSNSNIKQFQNTVGTIGAGAIHKQIPFFVTTPTNMIPGQGTGNKDVPLLEMRAEDNQMPLLVSNGNFTRGQNTKGNASQPTVGFFYNPPPLIVTNNNVKPVPNTSGERMPRPKLNNKIGAGTGTFVPSPTNDETPADYRNNNMTDIKESLPFRFDCGFEDAVESYIEAPLVSKSGVMPMQNIIDAVVSNTAKKPTGPVPSVNPLLHQMLTQVQASPSLPPTTVITTRNLKPLRPKQKRKKVNVQLLQVNFNKEPSKNNDRNERTSKINPPDDNNVDFETSIDTTVIVNRDKYTSDEILNAVNNKQLIASGEEEGIFGV